MAPKSPPQIFAIDNDADSEQSNRKPAASKEDDKLLQRIIDRIASTYPKMESAAAAAPRRSDRTIAHLLKDFTGEDFANMTIVELSNTLAALKMAQTEIETLVEKSFPYRNGQSGRAESIPPHCMADSDGIWSARTTLRTPQPVIKTWSRRSEDSGGLRSQRSTVASKDPEITRQEIVAMHRSIMRELRCIQEQQDQFEERMIGLGDQLGQLSAQATPIAQARLASPYSPRPGRWKSACATSDRNPNSSTGRLWKWRGGRQQHPHGGRQAQGDVESVCLWD